MLPRRRGVRAWVKQRLATAAWHGEMWRRGNDGGVAASRGMDIGVALRRSALLIAHRTASALGILYRCTCFCTITHAAVLFQRHRAHDSLRIKAARWRHGGWRYRRLSLWAAALACVLRTRRARTAAAGASSLPYQTS